MPITIRIPSFGGIRGKEHHGESPETYYVHTAGLKVVVPSTALDAYRLLRLAIADPDPVIVLEPKARYWSKEDGRADGRRPGDRRRARAAGRRRVHRRDVRRDGLARASRPPSVLAGEGIAARVVDLRSLSPLDVRLLGTLRARDGTGGRGPRGTA